MPVRAPCLLRPSAGRLRPERGGAALVLALLGAACAPLPDIATATRTVNAPPPVLVPLEGILAQADALGAGQAAIDPVAARADRLRDRADALRRQ